LFIATPFKKIYADEQIFGRILCQSIRRHFMFPEWQTSAAMKNLDTLLVISLLILTHD
jgi:hypothetical protein